MLSKNRLRLIEKSTFLDGLVKINLKESKSGNYITKH